MSSVVLRDEFLLRLRPAVAFDAGKALPAERFQGETLRPVLKFQNEWLLLRMRTYLQARHPDFAQLRPAKRKELLDHVVKFDKLFRAELIGAVLGLLTSEEAIFAAEHRADVSKRLSQLLVERFVSQEEHLL